MWSEDGRTPGDEQIENLIVVDGINASNILASILKKQAPFAKLDGHKVELFKVEQFTVCVVEEKVLMTGSLVVILLQTSFPY